MKLGTESIIERLTRRENLLNELEKEEKESSESLRGAKMNMESVQEGVRKELVSSINASKEIICHDVTSLVETLNKFSLIQIECIPCVENPVKEFQKLCEEIDVPLDIDYFLVCICIDICIYIYICMYV
jgi:hypothetical protein